jgi:uncharacterized protein (TIGR03000 family)
MRSLRLFAVLGIVSLGLPAVRPPPAQAQFPNYGGFYGPAYRSSPAPGYGGYAPTGYAGYYAPRYANPFAPAYSGYYAPAYGGYSTPAYGGYTRNGAYSPGAFDVYSPGLAGPYTAGVPALAYQLRPSAGTYYPAGETAVTGPREQVIGDASAVAYVNVLVPSGTALYFQGLLMSRTGTSREFVSPPLIPGQDYVYFVRATWNENGREVTQERSVPVRAGERVDVDLVNAPRGEAGPTLRTRPLP